MAKVKLRLEVIPTGVTDGPYAYMADHGLTFVGNVAEDDVSYSPDIQMILLTFVGNTPNSKVDYVLYLDNIQKKKDTAKIFHGAVGSKTIRFFLKAPV